MNLKFLVKLTNVVALISILLLIYWVFIFVSSEVFGFRIFRENITQIFAMSVLGILALMFGSLMINIMFNLTRIAQKHNVDVTSESNPASRKWALVFAATFPLLFGGLFLGDYVTSLKKETMLVQSAKAVLDMNADRTNRMVNYEFSDAWLLNTSDSLGFFEKTERNFPHVAVIVRDNVDGIPVFLAIRNYAPRKDENDVLIPPEKRTYLLATSKPDRDYLNRVFDEGYEETRFTASDGNYELFYPYFKDGKRIVLYFSDYQRFGKMGN
jgi:hypothetical protein